MHPVTTYRGSNKFAGIVSWHTIVCVQQHYGASNTPVKTGYSCIQADLGQAVLLRLLLSQLLHSSVPLQGTLIASGRGVSLSLSLCCSISSPCLCVSLCVSLQQGTAHSGASCTMVVLAHRANQSCIKPSYSQYRLQGTIHLLSWRASTAVAATAHVLCVTAR